MLFKQWMLLEKKSGFFPQHDKEFMQLRLRDILGNYAEKKWGALARIALAHKFAFVRKVTGRVAANAGTGLDKATGEFLGKGFDDPFLNTLCHRISNCR